MANPKHVEQLKRGIKKWNQWREQHPNIQPDLRDADLCNEDFRGANLGWAHLNHALLVNADLYETDFSEADLSGANLTNVNSREVNGQKVYLQHRGPFDDLSTKVRFANAHLRKANLTNADLRGADLSGADLRGATLDGANLSGADLIEVNLTQSSLLGTWLADAFLYDAILSDADLRRANLSGAILNNAKLIRANLSEADLSGANLSEADLSEVNLTKAEIINVDLRQANLSRTNFADARLLFTNIADADLRSVKGLAEINHIGSSLVELHRIQLPQDGSALHFLRGVGVPDDWIDFYRVTMMRPIQYYSCFLSYSSADDLIAKRLYTDLQANGVRCWFAPHDLKPGNYMRKEIDQAIHLQDKLLLILSESAVNSGWVDHEVELALAREMRQQREILFPIRLDNVVLQSTNHWATTLQATRQIGDFTNWMDPQIYQQAFDRLLRDLKKAKV